MDSKTIREKMTQGEWINHTDTISDDTIFTKDPSNGGDIVCLSPIVQGWEYSAANWRANAHAITSAVNGTYGAGIDPCKVKEMYDAIDLAQAELTAMYKRVGINGSNVLDKLNNLLTSAKLTA